MNTRHELSVASVLRCAAFAAGMLAVPAFGLPFTFSTGAVTDFMASATRPDTGGVFEIESADDFVLGSATQINSATFTGLLVPNGGVTPTIGEIVVEVYRVFPNDSDVGRTSGPPTFSTPQVPTRVNSPSDVAFDSRDSTSGGLSFTTTTLANAFTAQNSVQPGGIHSAPNQTTSGNGPITGAEVQFNVTFVSPFGLPGDHYFFVPQVEVTDGTFLWLSATRPISGAGSTPFMPDLQSWTRDAALDPDWLRIGTDIVGGTTPPTFNAAFTLAGETIPEPSTLLLIGAALVGLVVFRGRR
jgi:hypothetical protein